MILISNGGTNMQRARAASDLIAIGTVDGVVILERAGEVRRTETTPLTQEDIMALATGTEHLDA